MNVIGNDGAARLRIVTTASTRRLRNRVRTGTPMALGADGRGAGYPGRVAPASPGHRALSNRTRAPVWGASIISPAPT